MSFSDNLENWLINKTLKSGFIQSRILAWTRAGALAFATYLVKEGFADDNIAAKIVGFAVAVVTLYLQDLDVKIVNGKLKIAFASMPSGNQTPDEEKTETALLNTIESEKNKK